MIMPGDLGSDGSIEKVFLLQQTSIHQQGI
ncbi:hypothetical protein Bhyg_00866 [Pseudolycoriella hygida]|uniref:Uncharacterized protein n=1 Tax=Pseudolycoriella hygida TaxID=35572 RepID=A0A9Q0N8N7_9DIPT|nr:hypothetical protein Bhyg_00866 [Pseudolycoriella hygida]